MAPGAHSAERCPQPSAPRATVYARTLHRACQAAGSAAALAQELDAPLPALLRWIEGEEEPPMDVFLRAVDFALLRTPPAAND